MASPTCASRRINSFKVWSDNPERGYNTRIEIDGEDVSGSVRELTIHADTHGPVTVELDPCVEEHTPADRPARLLFGGKHTRELLIRHGWTPPPDPES